MKKKELEVKLDRGLINAEDKLLMMLIYIGYGEGKYSEISKITKDNIQGDFLVDSMGKKFELDEYMKNLLHEVESSSIYFYSGDARIKDHMINKNRLGLFSVKPSNKNPLGMNMITAEGVKTRFKSIREKLNLMDENISTLRTDGIIEVMLKIKKASEWRRVDIISYLSSNRVKASSDRILKALKEL